ncbi:MAG: hypothetical protein V4660_11085 [Pseudomonadota bacterium]
MDKIPPSEQNQNVSSIPFVILLNATQYEFYKTASVEILAPDGEYFESIGHSAQKDAAEVDAYQLHNQVALLDYLFSSINQDFELPARAVSGLADVFSKTHDYFMKYTK